MAGRPKQVEGRVHGCWCDASGLVRPGRGRRPDRGSSARPCDDDVQTAISRLHRVESGGIGRAVSERLAADGVALAVGYTGNKDMPTRRWPRSKPSAAGRSRSAATSPTRFTWRPPQAAAIRATLLVVLVVSRTCPLRRYATPCWPRSSAASTAPNEELSEARYSHTSSEPQSGARHRRRSPLRRGDAPDERMA